MAISSGVIIKVDEKAGLTKACGPTITTTSVQVPSSSEGNMSEILIRVVGTNDVLVSFDNEVSFYTICAGEEFRWQIKGYREFVHLKTLTGTSDTNILMNFED